MITRRKRTRTNRISTSTRIRCRYQQHPPGPHSRSAFQTAHQSTILSQPASQHHSSPSSSQFRRQPQRRRNPQTHINPKILYLIPIPLVITPRIPPQRHNPHHGREIPHEVPRYVSLYHVVAGDEADLQGLGPEREGACTTGVVFVAELGDGGAVEAAVEAFELGGGELEGEDRGEGAGAAESHAAEGDVVGAFS